MVEDTKLNNETLMDVKEIRRFLAHRYPFLLVDRVTKFESGKTLTAIKNVSINEPYFNGHFPEDIKRITCSQTAYDF